MPKKPKDEEMLKGLEDHIANVFESLGVSEIVFADEDGNEEYLIPTKQPKKKMGEILKFPKRKRL